MTDIKSTTLIRYYLESAPESPGVYKMYDNEGVILYIGKARNLKKRLSSYMRRGLPSRIMRMIYLIAHVEYTLTSSEATALLLEARLIKEHQPKFNILLKKDKSFPYIKLRLNHDFPQLLKYRGRARGEGKFFGPFASVRQVEAALSELQKIFKLRPCSDNYFATRTRPCLQYQIQRCYAPCMLKISKGDYEELVSEVQAFLSGKTDELEAKWMMKMQELSSEMRFEEAREIRDRIKALSYVQLDNSVASLENADVIAIFGNDSRYVIEVSFYRAGQVLGNTTYFPSAKRNISKAGILSSFIGQFYQTRKPAEKIILSDTTTEDALLAENLEDLHGVQVRIMVPKREGGELKAVSDSLNNAKLKLEQHNWCYAKDLGVLEKVGKLFNLTALPTRIEVYGNSHIMGTTAAGSMIVATKEGFDKKEYRVFYVESAAILPAERDDCFILRQVLTRRLLWLEKEPAKVPDLIIIDGGKGHMDMVKEIMMQLGRAIPFVCMTKGKGRDVGKGQFYLPDKDPFILDKNLEVMRYLQALHEEAHRSTLKNRRRKRRRAIA